MDAKLQIEIGTLKPQDARKDATVHLRVEDAVSGEVLVSVEMPAGQWWNVVTGAGVRLDGFISNHLDRVGRRMVWREVEAPKWVTDDRPFRGPEREEAVLAWGETQKLDGESIEARNTNHGWVVVFRSWPIVSDS